MSILIPDLVHQFEDENLILRFCRDVTSGLLFLHKSNCIPNDLAARTCQVDHFYNIKVTFNQLLPFNLYLIYSDCKNALLSVIFTYNNYILNVQPHQSTFGGFKPHLDMSATFNTNQVEIF